MTIYYLSDTNIYTTVETLDTTAPSSTNSGSGWTVDKKSQLGSYRIPDTQRASTTFVSPDPVGLSGSYYCTNQPLTGSFASGNWSLNYKVMCDGYSAQTGFAKFRLWRSTIDSGSGSATEVTSGWISGSFVSFPATFQSYTGSITGSLGAVALNNEYLFLETMWYASGSGGNNAADVYWVHNEGSLESLITPTFTQGYIFNEKPIQFTVGAGLTTDYGELPAKITPSFVLYNEQITKYLSQYLLFNDLVFQFDVEITGAIFSDLSMKILPKFIGFADASFPGEKGMKMKPKFTNFSD